uniref:ATP-dependent RNA helicase n=1 Tax=Panagrolaimus sp. PS1159 TaxID=55785 RepID=A0AC35F6V6_9BILA
MDSDEEYTSAEEISSSPIPSSPIRSSSPLSSPPSSFEIVEKVLISQNEEAVAAADIPLEEEKVAVIDEGPKSFQLKSVLANDDSSKDVKLLKANFFSKPKPKNDTRIANLMLDDDEEETEVVECFDDAVTKLDIQKLPHFAQKLFKDNAAAAVDGKEEALDDAEKPHGRPVHTKHYARDRIVLPARMATRPENEIKEGPNVNYDHEVTVKGGENEEFPNSDVTLYDIELIEEVKNNLKGMGIKRLRKIQQYIIPCILKCKSDIIGYAQTGNGKTLSYLIPLVNTLVAQNRREPSAHRRPSVAILLQNHETAGQVYKTALQISEGLDLQVLSAMGNNNMKCEISRMKHAGGDMVIGTTGRFIQYVSEGKIPLASLKYLVFDEADQFVKSREWESAMETFRHHLPSDHRTFLFSATYDDKACYKFDSFVKPNFWYIAVGEMNQVEQLVKQNFLLEPGKELDKVLIKLLISKAKDGRCPKTLVFTNTMDKADWIAGRLRMFKDIPSPIKIRAAALHSLIPATDRDLIFKAFISEKENEYSIDVIVASDKISCGVSTPAEVVINYDIPYDVSTYILRAGRTGRNGHNGEAYTFIDSKSFDHMPYQDLTNLSCMLTLAKQTDYTPLPDALEKFHKNFTANIK